MSNKRRPGVSRRLMPRDIHYATLDDQPIRGDAFAEGSYLVSIRRDYSDSYRDLKGDHKQGIVEGHNPIGLHLAREVHRALPGLSATIHQAAPPRVTKIGPAICLNCGDRGRKVDPESSRCLDRDACAKRAENWA